MKKPGFILITLTLLIILLSISQALVSNRLSTTGVAMSKIEEEIKYYKTQNAILTQAVLASSSFTSLANKANDLGFAKENSLFVVRTSLPLAIKQ